MGATATRAWRSHTQCWPYAKRPMTARRTGSASAPRRSAASTFVDSTMVELITLELSHSTCPTHKAVGHKVIGIRTGGRGHEVPCRDEGAAPPKTDSAIRIRGTVPERAADRMPRGRPKVPLRGNDRERGQVTVTAPRSFPKAGRPRERRNRRGRVPDAHGSWPWRSRSSPALSCRSGRARSSGTPSRGRRALATPRRAVRRRSSRRAARRPSAESVAVVLRYGERCAGASRTRRRFTLGIAGGPWARLDSSDPCLVACPPMSDLTHASAQQYAGRNVPREGASVARCLWQA